MYVHSIKLNNIYNTCTTYYNDKKQTYAKIYVSDGK